MNQKKYCLIHQTVIHLFQITFVSAPLHFGSDQKETVCLFVCFRTNTATLLVSSVSLCSCVSLHPTSNCVVAMQFGQLLTHLDTTQQMINNSLKDNNTLLTQVGSSASSSPSITDGLGDFADFAWRVQEVVMFTRWCIFTFSLRLTNNPKDWKMSSCDILKWKLELLFFNPKGFKSFHSSRLSFLLYAAAYFNLRSIPNPHHSSSPHLLSPLHPINMFFWQALKSFPWTLLPFVFPVFPNSFSSPSLFPSGPTDNERKPGGRRRELCCSRSED